MSQRKLLILSYAFAPSIGGIETVSDLVARSFSSRGYEVTVITQALNPGIESEDSFRVVRRPGVAALFREIRRADVVLQSNMSLRIGWPLWLVFLRKPFILVHHTPLSRPDGRLAWQDRLKRALLWRPYCLSVSSFLASTIGARSLVIPNPYDSKFFRKIPGTDRNGDLLFVGRLVLAKGVDTLLNAFAFVLKARPTSTLIIVGEGPELKSLQELSKSLGISESVKFLGSRRGPEVAELMNQHKILVIPSHSVPQEALSVVALEGVATGCVPVASRQGGLPDAVGRAGVLFEEGNFEELSRILIHLLNEPDLLEHYRSEGDEHLRQFHPESVANAYESHFNAVLRQ
jgi:glycosyltransferase involved in cell wall biosynthesis